MADKILSESTVIRTELVELGGSEGAPTIESLQKDLKNAIQGQIDAEIELAATKKALEKEEAEADKYARALNYVVRRTNSGWIEALVGLAAKDERAIAKGVDATLKTAIDARAALDK